MFTRTLLFIFCLVTLFAVLIAGIESEFYTYQTEVSSSAGVPQEVAEHFELANMTVYSSYGNGNMTYPWSSYWDHPNAPQHSAGLPSGQYLEVWWSSDYLYLGGDYYKALEFRHTTEVWWGLAYTQMAIYGKNGLVLTPPFMILEEPLPPLLITSLSDNWDDSVNASLFTTKSPVSASYMIFYNMTKYDSIADAWDAGELSYQISYELDKNATQMSIWGFLGAILTFQGPVLGLEGFFGTVVTCMIAVPFWIITVIAFIKLIQSIVPWIRGVEE